MNRNLILAVLLPLAGISLTTTAKAQTGTWGDIRERNRPAIVYIRTEIHYPNGYREPIEGTGFVVHPNGFILTCMHLLPSLSDEQKKAGVKSSATASIGGRGEIGREFYIIFQDPNKDLALLKLKDEVPQPLPIVQINWDSVLDLDQKVYALGFPAANPGSLDGTPGTIRSSFREFWITNAPIYYGNSGGPVFSKDGQVVGISRGGLPNSNQLNVVIPILLVQSVFEDYGIKIDETKTEVKKPVTYRAPESVYAAQIDSARKAYDMSRFRLEQGMGTVTDVISAHRLYVKVDLGASTELDRQISILKNALKEAKDLETKIDLYIKIGRLSVQNLHLATQYRIEREIELAKFQSLRSN